MENRGKEALQIPSPVRYDQSDSGMLGMGVMLGT